MRPRLLALLWLALRLRPAVGTVGARATIRPSLLALPLAVPLLGLAVAPLLETPLLLAVPAIATIAIASAIASAPAAVAALLVVTLVAALLIAPRLTLLLGWGGWCRLHRRGRRWRLE